jgi:hypothetical protein
MNEQNLDINLVIQVFQDKVSQLMMENIIKDATIKQLNNQIEILSTLSLKEELKEIKKDK